MKGGGKVYIVTQPTSVRGVYDTWPECKAVVSGVSGAKYQGVESREKAEAMLKGGIALPPGLFAFTDGSESGGVGVAIWQGEQDGSHVVKEELATTVAKVFSGKGIAGLESEAAIASALVQLRNILAELGGLHRALELAPIGAAITIVHDYEGISEWMEGRWQRNNPIVRAVIEACHQLIADRRLTVTYQHQRGHQSSWAGRDDFAAGNQTADRLATRGGIDLT